MGGRTEAVWQEAPLAGMTSMGRAIAARLRQSPNEALRRPAGGGGDLEGHRSEGRGANAVGSHRRVGSKWTALEEPNSRFRTLHTRYEYPLNPGIERLWRDYQARRPSLSEQRSENGEVVAVDTAVP